MTYQTIGRFAPSPTGDLHFGSAITANASYLQAKKANGSWIIRIEDIDPPREIQGSSRRIIQDLSRLGMHPDGEILFQSNRHAAYSDACQQLLDSQLAYWCACSRKDLPVGKPYPGTCRRGTNSSVKTKSIRLKCVNTIVEFTDGIQGLIREDLNQTCGDFIIQRSDGLPAYQLAVVLDDAFQGVTEVVRGADLLESTGRQIALQRVLGLSPPDYLHIPLVTDSKGQKLSKRANSDPLSEMVPAQTLRMALVCLGHQPPSDVDLSGLWRWAMSNWEPELIQPGPVLIPGSQ